MNTIIKQSGVVEVRELGGDSLPADWLEAWEEVSTGYWFGRSQVERGGRLAADSVVAPSVPGSRWSLNWRPVFQVLAVLGVVGWRVLYTITCLLFGVAAIAVLPWRGYVAIVSACEPSRDGNLTEWYQ